jgi:hypothetical protein
MHASASRCPSAHAQCTGAIPFESALASAPASTKIFTISSHAFPSSSAHATASAVSPFAFFASTPRGALLQSPSESIRFNAALLGGHDGSRLAPPSVARLTIVRTASASARFTASCNGTSLTSLDAGVAGFPRASFNSSASASANVVVAASRRPSPSPRVFVFTVSPARGVPFGDGALEGVQFASRALEQRHGAAKSTRVRFSRRARRGAARGAR